MPGGPVEPVVGGPYPGAASSSSSSARFIATGEGPKSCQAQDGCPITSGQPAANWHGGLCDLEGNAITNYSALMMAIMLSTQLDQAGQLSLA